VLSIGNRAMLRVRHIFWLRLIFDIFDYTHAQNRHISISGRFRDIADFLAPKSIFPYSCPILISPRTLDNTLGADGFFATRQRRQQPRITILITSNCIQEIQDCMSRQTDAALTDGQLTIALLHSAERRAVKITNG